MRSGIRKETLLAWARRHGTMLLRSPFGKEANAFLDKIFRMREDLYAGFTAIAWLVWPEWRRYRQMEVRLPRWGPHPNSLEATADPDTKAVILAGRRQADADLRLAERWAGDGFTSYLTGAPRDRENDINARRLNA